MSVYQAHGIAVTHCKAGCPVIILCDENNVAVSLVHVHPDEIEPLVALLREALADGEAARRPVV